MMYKVKITWSPQVQNDDNAEVLFLLNGTGTASIRFSIHSRT